MTDIPGSDRFLSPLEMPLESPPTRIVSLVPALTEALVDLDLGDRLVAISADCTRPAHRLAALPQVGGASAPDRARIVALAPDLVLLSDWISSAEDAAALQDAGLRVWVTGPRTVFDALNLLWHLMELCDHAVMVPRVREIERAYDYARAAAEASIPTRVFAVLGYDDRASAAPWITVAGDSYGHDVLRVCGGANVGAGWPRAESALYLRASMAQVIAAQPEVVLLPEKLVESGIAVLADWRALDLPAAGRGRIFVIDPDLLTWYGTRVAFALRDLPPLLMGRE